MDDSAVLADLAENFASRLRKGDQPVIEEYAVRHPALAERIHSLFPTLLLLEGLAAGSPPSGEGEASRLEAPAPGSTFGAYRVGREVGRGGMGVVFKAEHLALQRRVALKLLPLYGPEAPGRLERFLREAQTAAGLHHGNIVPVFDVGQVNGTPYYAMQFIDGVSLDQIGRPEKETNGSASLPPSLPSSVPSVPEGPARYRWVAEVGRQAAEGLAHAHARGVIHRDVKPSNLLLDAQGVVWITDFGLARRLAEDVGLTRSGQVVGTPRYMSPEQAVSAREPIDHRTDVYSLGATLYELLARRPAFDGPTPVDVVLQILERSPVPPSKIDPTVPRDLETVVLKAMARRPADRYPSARELAEDLRRFQAGEPIQARRIGAVGRLVRWGRRNPAMAALVAALWLMMMLSLMLLSVGLVNVRRQRMLAMDSLKEAQYNMQRAEEAEAAEMRHREQKEASLKQAENNLKSARRAVDECFNVAKEHPLFQEPRMEMAKKLLLEKTLPFYKQFRAQRPDDQGLRREEADQLSRVAYIAKILKQTSEAFKAYQQARDIQTRLARDHADDPRNRQDLAGTYHNMGKLLLSMGKREEAMKEYQQAREIRLQLARVEPEVPRYRQDLARTLNDLGKLTSDLGKHAEAEAQFHQARAIQTKLVQDHPEVTSYRQDLAGTLNNMGDLLTKLGKAEEAMQVYQQARAIQANLAKGRP